MRVAFVIPNNPYPNELNMMGCLKAHGDEVTLLYWGAAEEATVAAKCSRTLNFQKRDLNERTKALLFPIWVLWVWAHLLSVGVQIVQPQNLLGLVPAFVDRVFRRRRLVYLLTDFTADSSSLVLGLPKEIGSLVRWFERAVGSAADGLLAVSPGQLEVQLPGLRKRPHFIVFNTPEDGDVRPSISSRDMTTVFLYAGILTRQRLDGLIAAIGAVRRLPNVALTIAGSGECEGILRGVAQFAHNVQVIGQVPHEEVLSLTSEASCVLAMYDTSSLNNQIGLPNKLFEAMAYGKPVIVSKHSLAARVVAEHNCGLSVEYGNEKETYEAMKSACDLSWRVLHGTNGRSAFVNLYSWQSQQNGYLSFLGMFDAKAGGNRER